VVFLSKILASALGFAATVYIARLLGAEALGIYSLALTLVSWLGLLGTMGVTSGIKKRISEQEEPVAYAAAGVAIMTTLFAVAAVCVFLFRGQVNEYIGYPAAGYVVLMLGVTLAGNTVSAMLNGQHLVHVAGALSPVNHGSRAGTQIAALAAGLGIAGMFGGYVVGYLVFIAAGGVILARSLPTVQLPHRRHLRRVFSFAKYAWLGGLRSKAFNWVDIALLGVFVQTALVGYYTAAWNIAQFLAIFGGAVSQTLFPKMSERAAAKSREAVADLLNTALAFAGLVMIPGLVGAALLGERILLIYGSDFTQAELVFSILISATLLQSYQKQLTTTLNALDRPEIAFRVNLVFVAANVVLNIAFITTYGWVGAAVATGASVGVSLVVAHRYVASLLRFSIPTREIASQWGAAGIMGAVLVVLLWVESVYLAVESNLAVVLTLVAIGAVLYFTILMLVSTRFRTTVRDNVPEWIQYG
jgi:O-antigen/teichoic acid export membrane protein